jgi:DNA-binding NarL/FixJ family response regulator
MSKQIKLLLADDHTLIRSGLRQTIDKNGKFDVYEVDDGEKALSFIREHKPDIAILDIEMPGMTGFEVAEAVHYESLSVDIVFLTMFKDTSIFNKAMDIGVKGYVLKENTVDEIVQCVNMVSRGKSYISPAISDLIMRRNNKLMNKASDSKGLDQLTSTETKVMKLLTEMKTNQEMADKLGVSIKTIQNHRNNICNKLEISGAHALLKFAVENADRI